MDCIALTNAEVCRPQFADQNRLGEAGQSAHRGSGRASLTRCAMKHGEGFVDSPSGRIARIEHASQRSKVNPVGGAPSRSGFLATPINASSSRTFSTKAPHPGRRDAVSSTVIALRKYASGNSKVRPDSRCGQEKKSV
jgi:hypothetical protein